MKTKLILFTLLTLFSTNMFAATTPEGRCNNVKMTLLSIGSGSTRISYERAVTDWTSAELTIGIVGLGHDILNHADPRGGLIKAAYKWNLIPQKNAGSPLAGLYTKTEFIGAKYNYSIDALLPRRKTSQMALMAEGGYEWIKEWFVFDIYCGLGPSFGTGNYHNYYHGFMLYPADGWLAFTAGFRIGFAF